MAILAHRGITAEARDNSRNAIDEVAVAAANGIPMGLEIDVRGTLDSLILRHEPSYNGVVLANSNERHIVEGLQSNELISLGDALDLMAPVTAINLEIKSFDAIDETLRLIRKACSQKGKDPAHFVLSSFLPQMVKELKAKAPDFVVGCLIDCYFPTYLLAGESSVVARLDSNDMSLDPTTEWVLRVFDWTGADHLHPHWSHACNGLFSTIAEQGKRLSWWTVNTPELLDRLLQRPETAHMVTDFPHLIHPELTPPNGHRKAA